LTKGEREEGGGKRGERGERGGRERDAVFNDTSNC